MRIQAFVPRNQRQGPQNKVVGRNPQTMCNLSPRCPAPMLPQLLRPLLQVLYSYTALRNSALIATELAKKVTLTKKRQIDNDLADLFIDSYHPFSLVEERAFKKFARHIPGYDLPSRKTVSNILIPTLYDQTVLRKKRRNKRY